MVLLTQDTKLVLPLVGELFLAGIKGINSPYIISADSFSTRELQRFFRSERIAIAEWEFGGNRNS